MSLVSFVGVLPDPRTGFYEVASDTGVPVRLHDMTFLGGQLVTARARLVLAFRYDQPEWTPAAAVATPVAAFTFDGVRILHEEASEEVPPSYRGEVHDFAVDPAAGSFQLETAGVVLWFTAERATLVMRRDSAEFADGAARVTTLLG